MSSVDCNTASTSRFSGMVSDRPRHDSSRLAMKPPSVSPVTSTAAYCHRARDWRTRRRAARATGSVRSASREPRGGVNRLCSSRGGRAATAADLDRGVVLGPRRGERGLPRFAVDQHEVQPRSVDGVQRRLDRGIAGRGDRADRQSGVGVGVVRVGGVGPLRVRREDRRTAGAVAHGGVGLQVHALVEAVLEHARDLGEVGLGPPSFWIRPAIVSTRWRWATATPAASRRLKVSLTSRCRMSWADARLEVVGRREEVALEARRLGRKAEVARSVERPAGRRAGSRCRRCEVLQGGRQRRALDDERRRDL